MPTAQTKQQKGGRKLRRSSKDKSYYANQFAITLHNKARKARRRERLRVHWLMKNFKIENLTHQTQPQADA